MRSALAYALAAEGLDDRTIIRTIAWWRATQPPDLVRFAETLAESPNIKPPIAMWGICP